MFEYQRKDAEANFTTNYKNTTPDYGFQTEL